MIAIQQLDIKKLKQDDPLPFHLLLLADETKEAIEKYIYSSLVFTASIPQNPDCPIAIWVLYKKSPKIVELKNIAILPQYQNKGLGTVILHKIKADMKQLNYQELWVGTGDHSIQQLNFYRKNGFKDRGTIQNFFTDNYPYPIIENGKALKDMILLSQQL